MRFGVNNSNKNERDDLRTDSETCYYVWFGDGSNDKKAEGRAEDVKISLGENSMDKIRN